MLQTPSRSWLAKYRQDLLALFLFLFLTIHAGWEILANLDEAIIGIDNDVFINPWADWWTAKALSSPELSFWDTDYLYYPQGVNLTYHSFSHLNTFVSLALRPIAGNLPAYNVTILINYVLTGFAMFQLAHYLTGSAIAGILAGVVFAFNSHNLYQSAHPVLISIWCLPWLTLCLMHAVRENSVKWSLVAAFFLFLGALSSILLLIIMVIWLCVFGLYIYFAKEWPRPNWRIVLAFGLTSLVLTAPLLFPLLRQAMVNRDISFVTGGESAIVADMFSYFVPPWFLWFIRGLYIGIIPFFLALVAFGERRREARLWFFLLLGAYLFAIGPRPILLATQLDIVLPWSFLLTPLLRNPYRINILFSMGLAMVVAYGWLALSSKIKSRWLKNAAAILAMVLIFWDYTAGSFPSTRIAVSTFYTEFLNETPEDGAIAVLPTGRQQGKRHMFYQTFHERRITGGVVSRATGEEFEFIYENALLRAGAVDLPPRELPDDIRSSLEELKQNGIAYVVLDKGQIDVESWRPSFPSPPIFEDDLLLVYSTDQQ